MEKQIGLTSWYGSLSHYLQGFSTIPGGCLGISEPSTVLPTQPHPNFNAGDVIEEITIKITPATF